MKRRQVKASRGGGDQPSWLMTFADLMTLLLTFFILLLSFSNMDTEKYKAIAAAMSQAFGVSFVASSQGLPNLQDLGKLKIGENTPEMLKCDLSLELKAIPDLREGILICEEAKDFVSRDLLKAILESEEEHVDWLETQLSLIEKVGIQNYLQTKMGS